MTEFKREPRYIVFKIKDLEADCNTEAMVALQRIGDRVAEGRRDHGKPPFNAVVVEQDWPEFEPTWEAIEGRMTGKPIEPRYAIAIRIKELEAYQRNAGVWMAELIEKNDPPCRPPGDFRNDRCRGGIRRRPGRTRSPHP